MQLLCLLIFIGATQCDDSQIKEPANYDNLGVPNALEYVSHYTLSVQTSYITSVERMQSSNHYIQSGFSEIDCSSNDMLSNLMTSFKNGVGSVENMINGLQQTDIEKESQKKINAVVFMTANYYKKEDVTVEKTEKTLSEVTEIKQAQSILIAKRLETSYINFMNDVTTIKTKYTSETTTTNTIDANQWATLVQRYNGARDSLVKKTYVYAGIREAFMLGSGINLCDGSANTDQSLLDIYNTDDLSNFFGETKNDASTLLSQTVTQMYSIYKASLTNIYLKSVIHSDRDSAMRILVWEQVNLVRANFEYESQNIVLFIKTTQTDAESSFGVDSEDYKKIIIALYISVKRMLLTIVKSTEVHYKRALYFNPDGSMIKTDFNRYKVDIIDTYNDYIMSSHINAALYDIRLIEKEDSSYPSAEMILPQDTYSLLINKLVFQTFISQVNYVYMRIKKTQYDKTSVDSWINDKITMVEFQNFIIFFKYSVTINKIFIENSASYTYVLLTTDQNTQSNEVQQTMDQTSNDVVGVLSVNILEVNAIYTIIDVFISTKDNTNTKPIVYKPGTPKTPPTGEPNLPGGPPSSSGPNSPGTSPPTGGLNLPGGSPSTSGPNSPGRSPSTDEPNLPSGPPPTGGSNLPGGPPSTSGSNSPGGTLPTGGSNLPGGPPSTSGSNSPGGTPSASKTPPAGETPLIGSNNPQSGGPTNIDFQYSYIKSDTQITKVVQLLQNSIQNKITASLTNVQTAKETEYTKLVIQSLNIGQQISKYNTDYLYSVALDSTIYISEKTTPGSQEYFNALIVIFRDTQEKSNMLSSSMDIPFQRATMYSLTSTEYVYVVQTIEYSEFVKQFYGYFEVSYDQIYNSENDADLFLTNSIAQFNIIYKKVVSAVQQTPDDSFKTFLLCYLEKTITVYKQTTESFKQQIVQSKEFISQSVESSKYAFYQEIVQRLDSINAMYSGVLIESFQYSKNTASISIFESEYDIVISQTEIVSSYTSYTSETTAAFGIEIEMTS